MKNMGNLLNIFYTKLTPFTTHLVDNSVDKVEKSAKFAVFWAFSALKMLKTHVKNFFWRKFLDNRKLHLPS